MSKKILTIGIILISLSVVLVGCLSQNETKHHNSGLSNPIFKLKEWRVQDVEFLNGNATDILLNFSLYIENPNDETIKLQLIYLYFVDNGGNILYEFKPIYDNYYYVGSGISAEEFNLTEHENISFNWVKLISKSEVSEYFWNSFFIAGGIGWSVHMEGLYNLNGNLIWFETNAQ